MAPAAPPRPLAALLILAAALCLRCAAPAPSSEPQLYRRLPIPQAFLATEDGHTFGGDIRIGDLNGDGRCDFLVYRCDDRGPASTPAAGGYKPSFLGAFDLDGEILWQAGGGGTHPVRPMSVIVHDLDGDGAAEVICFWHAPSADNDADWESLGDVVIQVRDGRTGKILRQSAPPEITQRRRREPPVKPGEKPRSNPSTANWVHQRLLAANFRGLDRPRDFVVKLGDTHVAFTDELEVLWTHQTDWIEYGHCPSYIPAVGDIDGDGRDEVNSGYFLLDDDGTPLWEQRHGDNMDSVAITAWDQGRVRAICSGFGQARSADGTPVVSLGAEAVPHGQEVRVADFLGDLDGPEMAIRYNGHTPEVLVASSSDGSIVKRFEINDSPNNTGMEAVAWNGPGRPSLLYNGGWLWALETLDGKPLPDLPTPNGMAVHRMGFYHAIPADIAGDQREEIVLWDPTASSVFIYSAGPVDESAYGGYRAGPRQYNPRIMD